MLTINHFLNKNLNCIKLVIKNRFLPASIEQVTLQQLIEVEMWPIRSSFKVRK